MDGIKTKLEKVKEERERVRQEVHTQTLGYILAGLGLASVYCSRFFGGDKTQE